VQPGKIASKSLAGLDSGSADSLTVAASAGQFEESLNVLVWNNLLWWTLGDSNRLIDAFLICLRLIPGRSQPSGVVKLR
jgi:hypothetical protein